MEIPSTGTMSGINDSRFFMATFLIGAGFILIFSAFFGLLSLRLRIMELWAGSVSMLVGMFVLRSLFSNLMTSLKVDRLTEQDLTLAMSRDKDFL